MGRRFTDRRVGEAVEDSYRGRCNEMPRVEVQSRNRCWKARIAPHVEDAEAPGQTALREGEATVPTYHSVPPLSPRPAVPRESRLPCWAIEAKLEEVMAKEERDRKDGDADGARGLWFGLAWKTRKVWVEDCEMQGGRWVREREGLWRASGMCWIMWSRVSVVRPNGGVGVVVERSNEY